VSAEHELTTHDRVLSSLPLYHVNGQCIATIAPLVSGGSVVMPHRFSVSQWWPLVERYHPTWLNVVPTIIAYLINGPDSVVVASQACRTIRFARSASAPLPPEHHRAFESRFSISVLEAMGLTECASVAFANPLFAAAPQARFARPAAGNGGARRRPGRNGSRRGERGEIELRGDNVMIGYHKDPRRRAGRSAAGGWLATGDLGYRDADGFYFITGRLKELIIKGGENIAPREIDEALLKHPAVLEAAAVGIPDPDYGQEILACVVLKPGAACSEEELARALPRRARPVQDTEALPFRRRAAERAFRESAAPQAARPAGIASFARRTTGARVAAHSRRADAVAAAVSSLHDHASVRVWRGTAATDGGFAATTCPGFRRRPCSTSSRTFRGTSTRRSRIASRAGSACAARAR
jgi:acyl-CoA synthetase (AMP-forming)/AMP-acid ligase II